MDDVQDRLDDASRAGFFYAWQKPIRYANASFRQQPADKKPDSVAILRSASSPHLPSIGDSPSSESPVVKPGPIRRFNSETLLSDLDNGLRQQPLPKGASISGITLGADIQTSNPSQKSRRFNQKPRFTISKFAVMDKSGKNDFINPPRADVISDGSEGEAKVRSASSSFSSFARKSWTNASRSPSPSPKSRSGENPQRNAVVTVASIHPSSPIKATQVEIQVLPTTEGDHLIKRRKSFISRKSKRPLSAFIGKGTSVGDHARPGVPTIPKSFSTDRLPSLIRDHHPLERPPIMPRSTSSDRLQSLILDSPRKKDDLWSNFRSLDGEFQKYIGLTPFQLLQMLTVAQDSYPKQAYRKLT